MAVPPTRQTVNTKNSYYHELITMQIHILKTRTHRTRRKHTQDGKRELDRLLRLLHVVTELFPRLCINPTAPLAVRLGEIQLLRSRVLE